MGGKLQGIFFLIIGLGVALYFFNSGGAQKLGSVFAPPGSSSSSTVATTSISEASSSPTAAASSTSSSSSISSFWSFLSSLFAPPKGGFSILPQISPSGNNGAESTGGGVAVLTQAPTTTNLAGPIPAYEIPQGFTAAQLSPYFHLIRISGSTSQLTLYSYAPRGVTSTVDITGWDIKTNRSGEYIPQAVNIYDPTGLAPESDIILSLNETDDVYIYSNSAPTNVRINECMGYLNETHQFNPAFSNSCPGPNRSTLSSFTGVCQNYILSLSSGCQLPNLNASNARFLINDYQCEQYVVNNFSYHDCLEDNDTSPNFLSDQWRVWMGSSPLDRYHDNVELLDQNGLLVDEFSY